MQTKQIFSWILRIVAAVIMLQTLYFKFSGAPESVYIFTKVGIEPWGRIATGIAELIASLLLFIRPTIIIGALMGIGIMGGALLTHFTILGIEVQGDKGQLFIYAVIVMLSCSVLAFLYRGQLAILKQKIFNT
jgi:hypothetical protein